MKRDSAADLLIRMQALVQHWGWSLAMSAVLELRDADDRFITAGNIPTIAKVLRSEARYRARRA